MVDDSGLVKVLDYGQHEQALFSRERVASKYQADTVAVYWQRRFRAKCKLRATVPSAEVAPLKLSPRLRE
jgi:hypothetical protein